jgi:trimethylamine--corrinoid protein Co-methyltransferase
MGEDLARFAVEMASMIVGGKENLRQRPILSNLICTVAPLCQDKGGIESALVFAEVGLPVGFMAMPTLGSTAPTSEAGALVIAMAEILSGIVLLQIAYPGTPVFSTILPGLIDPRSGEYILASSFSQIMNAAAVQLSHFYGVPILNGASIGGTDYDLDHRQMGRENVYLPLLSVLLGAEMSLGLGLMDGARLLNPERVLFDEETVRCIAQISAGIEVSDETLVPDMISQVGPRGHFLGQEHTKENLPRLWPPSILYEKSYEKGERFCDPREVALEQVKWILKNHKPAQLDRKVKAEIGKLLEAADRETN